MSDVRLRYFGETGKLFSLYIRTALLTLLTLGIYRFWARTRIRKYIWSATSADNDSFEYTGTGLEKLLGFLVAIVVLAIYLGVVQMLLFYFGLNIFADPTNPAQMLVQIASFYITVFAVIPLLFFAQYRARRYKLARTRWRGIRFAMEQGAWGYALRAIGYYLLTFLTLGILWPLATYRLEKYMTDRSWYGDGQFVQNGRWQSLYKGMKHAVIGLVILIASVALAATMQSPIMGFAAIVGYIWILVGVASYRVHAFNYMTRNKVLDGQVAFSAAVETAQVVKIFILGSILVGIMLAVVFGVGAGVVSGMFHLLDAGQAPVLGIVVIALLYGAAFLLASGLSLVMITQPIITHAVDSIQIQNAGHLATIRQRQADAGADAEGFADALDIGGAI